MSLAHAILASLELQPMSGYDLKKFFDMSVGHFWSTTQSHIYRELDSLERDALVEKRFIAQESKPNRKEYSITEQGRAELRRWLTTPLAPAPVREAWLIQLFFSHTSSDAEIAALIEARGRQFQEILERTSAQTKSGVPAQIPPGMERAQELWQMTLDYGVAFYEFELRWNRKMLERVKNLPALDESEQ